MHLLVYSRKRRALAVGSAARHVSDKFSTRRNINVLFGAAFCFSRVWRGAATLRGAALGFGLIGLRRRGSPRVYCRSLTGIGDNALKREANANNFFVYWAASPSPTLNGH